MVEPIKEEPAGGQETGRHLEILDFENHIGLYGRLFIASQAKTAGEIANIINPVTEVEFKLDEDRVSLDKRDYNPVFHKLSFKERKDAWQEPYAEAKSKWKTQLTEAMQTIKKGSNRELALQAILPSIEDAGKFTEDHADTLFQTFCDGTSDVHKFTSTLLSNRGSIERYSKSFKDLLPDLQWIASGLFGRQTAGMVSQLVTLESYVYDHPKEIVDIFDNKDNKERIRQPQDKERSVLKTLYDLIPEAERVPVHAATVATTPKSAPVTELGEDKDEGKQLGVLPLPPPTEKPVVSESGTGENVVNPAVPKNDAETPRPTADQTNASAENIISMEGIGIDPADFSKALNELLEKNKNEPHISIRLLPNQLKEHITSMIGHKVKTGNIDVNEVLNKIIINDVQMGTLLARVGKFNLTITNRTDGNGIVASIPENIFYNRIAMKRFQQFAYLVENIDFSIKRRLAQDIDPDNSSWSVRNISIADGKVRVDFEKALLLGS